MFIQLINPPQIQSIMAVACLSPGPPIGLAYVAAAVRNAGHQVSIIDAIGEAPVQYTRTDRIIAHGLTQAQILDRIDASADVIGIGCMFSANWVFLRPLIHAIKARYPDKLIICGGEHFSGLPEYSMQTAPIDFIVMGEGENTIVALLDRIANHIGRDYSAVSGICWRDADAKIIRNCATKSIRDVDAIAWPAWDLVDLESYYRYGMCPTVNPGSRTLPIIATRGCPYECTYCSSPSMWTRRWYPRDPLSVVDEIEHYVKTYNVDHFPLQDLTPLMKREWIKTFAEELIRRNLNIKWQTLSGTRSEVINEEILKIIKASGCDTLNYAPETGSDRVREGVKKYINMDRMYQAIDWTVKAGLNLGIFIVIGLPDETEADIRETVKMARKIARLGVLDISPSFYIPIPGTDLFNELVAEGRLELNDETLMIPTFLMDARITEKHNMCRHMSAAKLSFYKWWIILNFFVVSWVTHPQRLLQLVSNLLKDKDTTKLSKALNIVKNRWLARFGAGRFASR